MGAAWALFRLMSAEQKRALFENTARSGWRSAVEDPDSPHRQLSKAVQHMARALPMLWVLS